MSLFPTKAHRFILLFFTVFITFSCSKDTDLLADYVNPGSLDGNLRRFVVDDAFLAPANASIQLNVLANDTFPEDADVQITGTSSPGNGSVSINEDYSLTYSSDEPMESTDSFTYTTEVVNEDNTVSSETGTVTVTISGVQPEEVSMGLLKAFPSAFGGGSNATGGRGKALAIITTLNRNTSLTYHAATGSKDEYYTGGLYAAMQNKSVGYIVFNVSGNIDLGVGGTGSQFGFAGMPGVNDKTIFGQSAPQGGITLTGGTFRIDGSGGNSQNLIFRYFRSRPIYDRYGVVTLADDAYTWAFLFFGGNNVVVDHCSASFAQDKAMGAFIRDVNLPSGLMNFTFSNNLLAESGTGGYTSINPGLAGNPEDYVDLVSWIKNVFVAVNRTPNLAFNGRAEKLNNVMHNTPYKQTSSYHELKLNEIGNYSSSDKKNIIRTDINAVSGYPRIHSDGNYHEGILTGVGAEDNGDIWRLPDGDNNPGSAYFTPSAYTGFPNPWRPLTAAQTFTELIKNGNIGAYKYLKDDGTVGIYRDSFDTSQLAVVLSNSEYSNPDVSNWVLPALPSNTRPNNYDTDHDGMSDAWEIASFGTLEESYRGDFDGDGYENIEEYMNQVDFQ